MFHGPADRVLFHPDWPDKASFEDTGNVDARTEGMSYSMMMAVQMDRQEDFDRLWNFSMTFMHHKDGPYRGYFAWTTALDGTRNADGPAPDGEEYYALALFFASHRWGDREAPYNYSEQARAILHECVHKGENGEEGRAMWDPENYLIRFVPEADSTDASYHLPHFYELFALWANEEDRAFWKKAAAASREYLHKACHPVTGLAPEFGEYDGSPRNFNGRGVSRYYSDAYRVPANIGLDSLWFNVDPWQHENNGKLQKFFCETEPEHDYRVYMIDGTVIDERHCIRSVLLRQTLRRQLRRHNRKRTKIMHAGVWNSFGTRRCARGFAAITITAFICLPCWRFPAVTVSGGRNKLCHRNNQ